ncbi:MAG TPA: GTPase HflX [Candidatus Kapabacteria bacterium]|nr:GTPase HflX [Candidatus Kapabacteria bacterium]
MSEQKLHTVAKERERAILVGVTVYPETRETTLEHLDELELLLDTAGGDSIMKVVQGLPRHDGAFLLGKGKVEELAQMVEDDNISLIVVDDELSPMQSRNLEKVIKRKVIDRTQLILDIFASRAQSSEARTQVELAQLQYMLPRLTRQWTHLSKQFGGIGTKGPGETQIETDRRLIRDRISHLREKLDKIETQRETQRKGRADQFRVALVGYTNAGKSTLMNELAGPTVHAEDRLFATLDTTVRQIDLAPGRRALLSDTVGFIRKLPPNLIASFRSTLAEAKEADVLLHVVDIASPNLMDQISVVDETLREIGAVGIPTLMVFNKVDVLEDPDVLAELSGRYPESVAISAARGLHISALRERMAAMMEATYVERTIRVPVAEANRIAKIHEYADVLDKRYDDEYGYYRLRYSPKLIEHIESLIAAAHAETVTAGATPVEH